MYVEFDVPDIAFEVKRLGGYWLKIVFIRGITTNFQINALTTTYMRIVEAALTEYCFGQAKLKEYWSTHHAVAIGSMLRAASHFESCITDMHRAINCFTRLRRRQDLPSGFAAILQAKRPGFIAGHVSGQLRKFRDEIHHLDEMIVDGRIQEGLPIALKPDGPEVQHPSEANQTIKTIDRIVIAQRELRFSDIAMWLKDMCHVAEEIANYRPPG
mgnify:CR=1 FL=1